MQSTDVPTDLSQLDAWLAEQESRVPNLVPGAEKMVRWASEPGTRTPLSIIYLHGFSATRQELVPVFDRVSDSLSANIFYTRFAGHGRDQDAMGEPRLRDWVADTREAWRIGRLIGDRVVVVGTSTGAPLAAWLAAHGAGEPLPGGAPNQPAEAGPASQPVAPNTDPASAANQPAALILISPNFAPADSRARMLLWPGGRLLARIFSGPYRSFEPENEQHERYWTARYPSESLVTMMEAVRLGRRANLESIRAPSLVVYTERDDVVSVPAIKEAFDRLGSPHKELLELPGADRHVLAGDILSPQTTDTLVERVERFLDSHLSFR